MKTSTKNLILLGIVAIIILLPLIFTGDSEFGGADGEAEGVIAEISPDYEPWISSIWEPPSGEIESLLFALQAAIGSGIIAYIFGYMRGKRKSANNR